MICEVCGYPKGTWEAKYCLCSFKNVKYKEKQDTVKKTERKKITLSSCLESNVILTPLFFMVVGLWMIFGC